MIRYYIPTIDEFTDGFEYEEKVGLESPYETRTFKNESLVHDFIAKYRVRYLNKRDVLDLGFIIDFEEGSNITFYRPIEAVTRPDYITLEYRLRNKLPYITLRSSDGETIMAPIHIKNVHELKWLLNRYGY